MEYRIATLKDIDILTEMNICLRADEQIDSFMTDDEVRERMVILLTGNYKALIFSDGGTIIGYSLTEISRKPMYLRQLYVKNGYRRKGFGKKMVEETMAILNADELDIEVMAWNDAAREFYRKIGCRERYIGLRYVKNKDKQGNYE